ncbi:MAG: T9SS type A sorting domain-containing protein, partial [Bacteroidota bacterium]|nr:T9SS type A sorting domain-containing protein [Bacteroidota bacterium]
NGSFGNITSFTMSSAGSLYPSLGTYSTGNAMMLIWNLGNNVYSAQFDGTNWGNLYLLGSGAVGGTGLNITAQTSGNIAGAWKESDGHLLAKSRIDRGLQKTTASDSGQTLTWKPLVYHINRHSLVELQSLPELNNLNVKGLIGFEVARFDKDSTTPIGFLANDALFIKDSTTDQQTTFRSDEFSVRNNSDKVTLVGAYYAKGLELPSNISVNDLAAQIDGSDLAVVTLKESTAPMKSEMAPTATEIWRVPFSHLTKATGGTDGEYRKIPVSLNGLAEKELRLDVAMLGSGKGIQPIIVNDYLILSDQDQQMEQLSKSAPRVITDYALFQNYPNPFNPTTEIDYQLKEDGKAHLAVYDVLGREVAVLVDEYKSAGYYSAYFDAHALSSGVYFYRLIVNNNNGKSLFSDTKRLVLMK